MFGKTEPRLAEWTNKAWLDRRTTGRKIRTRKIKCWNYFLSLRVFSTYRSSKSVNSVISGQWWNRLMSVHSCLDIGFTHNSRMTDFRLTCLYGQSQVSTSWMWFKGVPIQPRVSGSCNIKIRPCRIGLQSLLVLISDPRTTDSGLD